MTQFFLVEWIHELRAKASFAAHSSKDGVECVKWHPTDRNQLATCSISGALKVRLCAPLLSCTRMRMLGLFSQVKQACLV